MVSKKIRNRLRLYIKKSCKYKAQYNLFTGLYRVLLLKIKGNGNPHLYKCSFCIYHHVGNISKNTLKRFRYFENVCKRIKIDQELRKLGVKI